MLSSAEFHKDFLSLRIKTSEIGVDGLQFAKSLSKESLCALLFEQHNELFSWKAHEPVEIVFLLSRENDHSFLVKIRADFSLSSSCVRCLEPLEHRFHLDFSIRMLDRDYFVKNATDDSAWLFDSNEIEMSPDRDISVGYFSNECIDLGVVLREQIFFEAPDYPHCLSGNGSLLCRAAIENNADETENKSSPFFKLLNKSR